MKDKEGKTHALVFNVSHEYEFPCAEIGVCVDVGKLVVDRWNEGYSVYQGFVEYREEYYMYVIAFAGIEQLVEIQAYCAAAIESYMLDAIYGGFYDDVLRCVVDRKALGDIKREMR